MSVICLLPNTILLTLTWRSSGVAALAGKALLGSSKIQHNPRLNRPDVGQAPATAKELVDPNVHPLRVSPPMAFLFIDAHGSLTGFPVTGLAQMKQ